MNIRSLNSKVRSLCQFNHLLDYMFDVIVLSEIWAYNIDYYRNILPGYEFYYNLPIDSKVGGVGHWSLVTICGGACPFHASVLRPASQVGPMHKAAGMGKLVNAALLSLINEACVSICCATLLLSQLVAPLVCRHDRVTREVGRVGLVGRDQGRGDIEWRCTCIFILSGF